ncbi:hypothetical protein EXU57_02045 [Segetibacter sp. 3557_3]|uniref:hypothetical protein n=1 Tax=Segetibacter sp. 3557_3 TaxID=2547429 RepID=UPI0010583BB8|nr:hypothetical protein [Segetibacter sp. 3557_3]TDH28876.1 hypothetical protein EXU57_02045 [Segetibacter sp. 3557_3]
MNVRKEDFPVVLQAYELVNNKETFIAEQVVNNQSDVDNFSARYTGKLIKAKQWTNTVNTTATNNTDTTILPAKRKKNNAVAIIITIIVLIIILLAIAYYTGWLQQYINVPE